MVEGCEFTTAGELKTTRSGFDHLHIRARLHTSDCHPPALSTRPSRFDRKFLFDDPDRHSRRLYVRYWQDQLADSEDVSFPESLAEEIADSTDKFSFAYLKEVLYVKLMNLRGSC